MTHEFTFGSIFFLPNGTKMYRALELYFRNQYKKRGYDEVITPELVKGKLFRQSGHLDNYVENMFCVPINDKSVDCTDDDNDLDEVNYYLSSMNCPKHCLIFDHSLKTYKQLPIRMADFGSLHRFESSGSLRGLNRLRCFHQDDAHIFCTIDQIFDEIKSCMDFLRDTYKLFGFNYEVTLSTRPDKFMGDIELWIDAEKNLKKAIDDMSIVYTINEKDGAFYGPKIDIMVKDSTNRKIQCGTIQLDFQLPQRFGLEYIDYDSQKSTPVIVHRAICGSIERMLGILIEHFQGKFPVWLSPRQIAIIPVATKPEFKEYCEKIKQSLTDFDPRLDSIKVFDSHETFDYRIRDAETKLYNYVLIIGKKEIDTNSVTFRIINHKRNDIKMVPLMIYVNKSKSHTMILLLIKQNISSLHFVSIKPITSLL
jgi:threonyl-tRNA synthetase